MAEKALEDGDEGVESGSDDDGTVGPVLSFSCLFTVFFCFCCLGCALPLTPHAQRPS